MAIPNRPKGTLPMSTATSTEPNLPAEGDTSVVIAATTASGTREATENTSAAVIRPKKRTHGGARSVRTFRAYPRDGKRIYYRLASDHVGALWAAMRNVAGEHVAGIEQLADAYLGDRGELEMIVRDELAARLRRGDLIVLDVRPEPEFRSAHIAGARSIPVAELRRRLRNLPKDAEVVACCRGPYCVYADEAVRELHRRGYRARRLQDGFPEWKQPVSLWRSAPEADRP